jgi:hypothetical protein
MFPEAMTPPRGVFGWCHHQSPDDARLRVWLELRDHFTSFA